MTNIELFEKVKKELALDKYDIICTNVVDDLSKATIKMGTSSVGELETINGIIHFTIGSQNFRILRIGDGFQVFSNFFDYQLTYTSIPKFDEIIWYSNNTRLTISDQDNDIRIRLLSDIKPNDPFLLAKDKIESYDTQDRKIELSIGDNNIRYRYYEMYHINKSSAPIWDYKIDTFNNACCNWLAKGKKIYETPLDKTIEEAKSLIMENLIQNEIINDISSIEEVSRTAFVKRLNFKINNSLRNK